MANTTDIIALPADGSYTLIVEAAVTIFTAQALSADGIEVIFSDSAPSQYDGGLLVRQHNAASRNDGEGDVYARPYKRPGAERIGALVALVTA